MLTLHGLSRAALQDRLERALARGAASARLARLAMALAQRASPDPRTERLLALANRTQGIVTPILQRYPVTPTLCVDCRPEPTRAATAREAAREFRGKHLVVMDPHSDDAPFFLAVGFGE